MQSNDKKKRFTCTDQVPSVVEEIGNVLHLYKPCIDLYHNNGLWFFCCRVHTTAMDRDYWENILTPYTVSSTRKSSSMVEWSRAMVECNRVM